MAATTIADTLRERWTVVDRVLDQLLEHSPPEWPCILDNYCQDYEVRQAVESLLERSGRIHGFMEQPAALEIALELDQLIPDLPCLAGRQLGSYRLVREICRGGMGVVWLAEHGDTQEPVAIKLMYPWIADADLVRRFQRERRILASIQHPGIAELLHADVTEDGQAYLVLEYVDGLPIDRFCAQHSLNIHGRLNLFVRAARAVEHAHSYRIVHRDLKPSNILVAQNGDVKLVDFGIAKLLDEPGCGDTATRTDQRWLTLSYAAPEQLRGEPVTALTDVYQLGVVLYELLTGRRPLEIATSCDRLALLRAVLETEPDRPSIVAADAGTARAGTLQHLDQLSPDLDAIALKALRKQPPDRYHSVGALVEDIERYLVGRPVLARAELNQRYFFSRLRKYRWALVAGAALAMFLAGYIVAP